MRNSKRTTVLHCERGDTGDALCGARETVCRLVDFDRLEPRVQCLSCISILRGKLALEAFRVGRAKS